jgi:hypothetical protein
MVDGDRANASEGAAPHPRPTIFLSYASQDREAAQSLRDALTAFELEVWYDESGLGGGEAWDQKIRKQIRECDYFMPVVSAQTEARLEGYFRREWRLAVERTLDMADDHLFLLPVVIDDTDQVRARVPERFLTVQWVKVPGGRPTPALEALCRRVASGETAPPEPAPKRRAARRAAHPRAAAADFPAFPTRDPGQKQRFWFEVFSWACRAAWVGWRRLPRWLRLLAIAWLAVVLISRGCTPQGQKEHDLSPATTEKLKAIAQQYQGSSNKADVAKLGAQIAREFAGDTGQDSASANALLAIPFSAPPGAAAAAKLADSAFAMVYGRVALSRGGHVELSQEPLALVELGAALERGLAHHARYVLFGTIENSGAAAALNISIAAVEPRSILWSKSYPVTGSDPATIAAEVDSRLRSLED